jgi:hypothetical protein
MWKSIIKNVYIKFSAHVSGITCIMYAKSYDILKPNNSKVVGSKKIKVFIQDNQNQRFIQDNQNQRFIQDNQN